MKEAQFAARLSRVLDTSTDSLPPRVTARLAASREAALSRVAQSAFVPARPRTAAAPSATPARLGRIGALASHGPGPLSDDDASHGWRRWFAAALPLLIVLAGLVSIGYWDDSIKAEELADIETAVLTDDVPLETLAERGFGVFLTTGSAQ